MRNRTVWIFIILVVIAVPYFIHADDEETGVEMKQYIYTITANRAGFAEGSTPAEDRAMGEHFEYLKKLTEDGVIILAGPCLDYSFGVVIFRAKSDEAAREIMNGDPSVKAGVMAGELHPFKVSLIGEMDK